MEFSRSLLVLVFIVSLACIMLSEADVYSPQYGIENQDILPSKLTSLNISNVFYGIMFDAGSTGTRIHIYSFIHKDPEPPQLDSEIFESVKPGLSAYVDDPEQVQELFEDSPFLVPDDCVSIMNGTYEGILAWLTINILTGHLYGASENTVGILDLGGASTQITFLPQAKSTLHAAPEEYISSFEMFNKSYKLYTHSYLGFGLKVARLAVLGALDAKVSESRRYRSSCLPQSLKAEWKFGGVNYKFGGMKEVPSSFQSCYTEVTKVIQKKLDQQDEIKSRSFYAFSYYYDRAVDTGMIDGEKGGVIFVKDFEMKALEVCKDLNEAATGSPFLCMDLTYITALLKEGFGFYDNTELQLTKKVNNIETSWALGAAFHLIQSLKTTP
ncbi:ectonucleoside triphosphate diphosphohydrolase 5 isoform X2 [Heterodontus francisci]|uniref:ectonucleoside triphosphate diphosphohydrolase 5 isoform X2 n=1 Tax=Heterodontus francisci TaxID=7792 RepID=UPI00355AF4EC